jgi:hypothetical protein
MGRLIKMEALSGSMERGVLVNNQGVAFSFLLRFVGMLGRHTVEAVKEKGDKKIKVGTIRPLSSLLLGVNFATSMYVGSKWFHGLTLYPVRSSQNADPSPIRDLCRESHDQFWESLANVANCFRSLDLVWMDGPSPPVNGDVRDFQEFMCYVPFESFLHRASEGKYASLEEAMDAMANHSAKATKAEEDDAIVKIRLLLGAVSKATRPSGSEGSGSYFLEQDADSNTIRVLRNEDAAAGNVEDLLMDHVDNNFDDVAESEAKSQYSNLGIQLLTPAALLADNAVPASSPLMESTPAKVDNLVPNLLPDLTTAQQSKPVQSLHVPPGLPPPPGFGGPPAHVNTTTPSVNPSLLSLLPQPQQQAPSLQPNAFGSNLGNSLGGTYQTSMPQAGPNLFNTLNPFANTSDPYTGGIDLNFMLNDGLNKNHSSAHVPSAPADDPYNHGESLLKFLFESNSSDD